jgi:UDP-N-acetylglucosamine:LPS N-acetylglucosamine transferase
MNDLVLKLEHTYPEKQILVVTGQNRALYESLTSGPRNERTTVYGFVNNMESLMAASDIVVTKAGPGTLMEALVMRRPVIITEAVGPQEEGNIDFVVNRKLGFFCPTNEQIIQAINALSDERCYTETVARLENAVPSDGGEQIAAILLKLLQPFSAPARHTL